MKTQCYHCGDDCGITTIEFQDKTFCCNGCKTVYEIFYDNDLTCYYDLQQSPGAIPIEDKAKYNFLDNKEIVEKLLEFNDEDIHVVNLYIPHIHCSSCIWILENINKLQKNIISSQVNFPKKTLRITFNSTKTSLKEIVLLLNSIGYEPYISLDDFEIKKKKIDRSLLYKLGLSFFVFGNVMLLSLPEYFEVNEFWLEKYKYTFRWMMLIFSLPVVFYASQDYFISAYKGIRSKILNIDVPISLGIFVLFIRSTFDIVFDLGSGFFDSLTGLVFFLLLGKFFQKKTYSYLSFERDYKSYFPIAVTRILSGGKEENTQLYKIKKGDRLLIRNQELIPVDGVLISGNGQIDYSFVTGEALSIKKKSGDKLFAGGKQLSGVIEMEVLKSVEQSYLTQLWSNDIFNKNKNSTFKTLTDRISKNFTIAVLSIAFFSSLFWLYKDSSKVLNVLTAVLIIACPCAIALAAPFTLGNVLRIFGNNKFYLKNSSVIEHLAKINFIIFDKTGTLTTNKNNVILYKGSELTLEEKILLKSALRVSNHPLSRNLYNHLKKIKTIKIDRSKEVIGKGIEVMVNDVLVKIGSFGFVGEISNNENLDTSVYFSFNNIFKGSYTLKNKYRNEINNVFEKLEDNYKLAIVSGDNKGEKEFLKNILPLKTTLLFNQKPKNKLDFVVDLQEKNNNVVMIGDGLNDAGALAQSNVGIALSENINVFSPACDAILDATKFGEIPLLLHISRKAIRIIKYCFLLSLFYNSIGLYYAITGKLEPVVAAILMPLSSISIVIFTTLSTNFICRKLKK